MAADPIIRLSNLAKSFALPGGTVNALRGIDLSVRRGAIFGIAGRSGAGKSTLLRMINLLERPDAGRAEVAGRELTALSKPALRAARQDIGMIFQQFNLLRNLSVFDNVAFPLRLHGRLNAPRLAQRRTTPAPTASTWPSPWPTNRCATWSSWWCRSCSGADATARTTRAPRCATRRAGAATACRRSIRDGRSPSADVPSRMLAALDLGLAA